MKEIKDNSTNVTKQKDIIFLFIFNLVSKLFIGGFNIAATIAASINGNRIGSANLMPKIARATRVI